MTYSAPEENAKQAVGIRAKVWRLLRLNASYKKRLGAALLLSCLASLISLAVPLGLRELLDAVFQNGDAVLLDWLALALFSLFVLQACLGFFGRYLLRWTGERVVADLRKRLYTQIHSLDLGYVASERTGDITSRLISDVEAVREAITDASAMSIMNGIRLVGSVALMVAINWRLSILILLVVPASAIIARILGRKVRRLSRKMQDRKADSTSVAEETLAAFRLVKSFARTNYETKRYGRAVESLFDVAKQKVWISGLFQSMTTLLFYSALAAVFWYGGREVLAGRLTQGDLVAFVFYAYNVAQSVNASSRLYTIFNEAIGASGRIFEILDEQSKIQDAPDATELDSVEGALRFEQVSFGYESGEAVLHDLNFEVDPGETVALIGPSGAGKTTLLNLIARFHDPTSGKLFLDGYDVRSVKLSQLRERTALVSQNIQLFSTSVRENIRYGRLSASDGEVEDAARAASAHEFIQSFPAGYDTEVGERGMKLSGGQRQRIAIARALLKDVEIILLDEPTSSLDVVSQKKVRQALAELIEENTAFVVSHHFSSIRGADRILVLNDGRVIQDGTHSALVRQDGFYSKMLDHHIDDRAPKQASRQQQVAMEDQEDDFQPYR